VINIIDNLIKESQENYLEELFLSCAFPWFYQKSTIDQGGAKHFLTKQSLDTGFFAHTFAQESCVNSSEYYIKLLPIFTALQTKNVNIVNQIVVRANLTFPDLRHKPGNYKVPHNDTNQSGAVTAIYYVNDSDGDTLFFDDNLNIVKRVSPKKGRTVLFDSEHIHASESNMNTQARCVINFNFFQS
jgi:hypothetical protein